MPSLFDIETETTRFLVDLGFDPTEPPAPEALARAAVGADRVILVPGLRARAQWRRSTDTIEVRPGLSPLERGWCLVHELGERSLVRGCWSSEVVELYSDAYGAALMVPAPALRKALRAVGRNLDLLAAWFGASQTIVTLRLSEVTGSPLALVAPRWVKLRGEEWGWPSEREVRTVAARHEVPPGLERRVLSDARGRVALWAA
jgi:hypothetical protein